MTHDEEYEEAKLGSQIDRRYRLFREIARGGMGLVFEAEHLVTGQRVAVKVLARAHLGRGGAAKRLLREARILGSLRHPNVVLVQDAGTCPTHGPYLAMELIEGRPLDGILLTRATLPVGQAVAMALQLCSALEEVHRRGVVHRDLKPANILISHTAIGDQVELLDFGVSKPIGELDAVEQEKLTQMGEMLGTREYMAPEQLMNGVIDPRTDVYGASAVLYECLCGDVPYGGPLTTIITEMLKKTRPAPLRARRAEIPAELEQVVAKGLELDPANRWPTVRALARASEAALGQPLPRLELLELRGGGDPEPQKARRETSPTMDERSARRRQHVRAPYVAPARIVLADGTHLDGRTEDLSEGGVLVVTQRTVPRDQPVKVRMPLPGIGKVVEIPAILRWIKERRNVFAVGLEFDVLAADVRAAIQAYVQLMSGAPPA